MLGVTGRKSTRDSEGASHGAYCDATEDCAEYFREIPRHHQDRQTPFSHNIEQPEGSHKIPLGQSFHMHCAIKDYEQDD